MPTNLQLAAFLSLIIRHVLGVSKSATTESPIRTKVYNLSLTINDNFDSYSEFSLYYFPNVMLFDRYFTLVLFIIGFPGNFISFFVWANRRMYHGNSAAVYLAALSLNDTVVLAIALFRDLTKNWGVHYSPTPGSCEALELINLTTQYSSPLFVLAFTIERWLAICEPFLVSRICSVRRALYVCIGISTFTLLVCLPNTYLIMTTENGCEARNESVFYFTTTLEVIYSLCAPLLVLTFNCLVINEVAKIRRSSGKLRSAAGLSNQTQIGACLRSCMLGIFKIKQRGNLVNRPNNNGTLETVALATGTQDDGVALKVPSVSLRRKHSEPKAVARATDSPKFRSTTMMLLVVSFYVIIATLLGGVMYLLETKVNMDAYADLTMYEFARNPDSLRALRIREIKTVFDELALSHFAMGFVLYFSSGRNFRNGVRRFFQQLPCCWRSKSSDNAWGPNSTTSADLRRTSSLRNVSLATNISTAAAENAEKNKGKYESRPAANRSSPVTKTCRQIRLNLPGCKREKKEDFPGLQDCGRRGTRAPSRLVQLTQKADPDPPQDV